MRPLPRLLAFTDDRIALLDDLDARAAAIAAAGPAAALVARRPQGTTDQLSQLAQRLVTLSHSSMASVLVTGRADVALAVEAQGVILREGDLTVTEVRKVTHGRLWCLRSVHSEVEADSAVADGADALVVGTIWPSASHPERTPSGLELLARISARGVRCFAIGGVTPARAREARDAGAWGVAAIRALWDDADPCRAACALIEPWLEQ
jgi:thiamine-phosphate pyrophosphorylase